jgi:hypothetical protein
MRLKNTFFLVGVVFLVSGLIFTHGGPIPPQTQGSYNLVQDSNFARFGQYGGPWGKGQYGEKGIWWNSYHANSTAKTIYLKNDDTLFRSYGVRTALYISNRSPAAPHVYGTTVQKIITRPGRYTLTVWASARNLSNGAIYFVVDKPWNVRPVTLRGGNYGWTQFRGSFTTNTGEIQLRIISANTGEAWLTGISITPGG